MKTVKITLAALAFGLMSFTTTTVIDQPTIVSAKDASPVVWKSETVDVGEIPQGTPKTIEFSFKNTGTKSVLITNVKPSCGCTAADYTKEAVAPGKTGYVKATYNAAAAGAFAKTITVTTNAEETPKVLTFKGTVVAKS
ncbi:Protein of unknown function [Flavobacterium fontis]|uniref:DUF1573 domain-containing protein n=1 Tax=Flavobacterium fontis TaxID=1124188 RepID=A0A1M5AFN5_9FLAO|nr:DUF1573 domain-containing protein [Flavobacterium fontis]SHF28916.1 Protein of unknown function [Flavobacterium fontis]